MTHTLLVGPATIFTNNKENSVLADAGVLCVGDRVERVGPWSELEPMAAQSECLRADGKLVLPGLINAHHHLYSTFSRSMPLRPDAKLGNFPEILEGIWWRLDRALDLEAVEAGAYPPLMDCLRCGTTTIVDHHASPNAIHGSLDALAKACSHVGVRASLCYEITDRNGLDGANEGIEENARFIEACKRKPDSSALIGLHASFTVSDETLARVAARIDPSTPIHIHVAEDISDVMQTKAGGRPGIIARLEKHGLLRENSVLVHGIHLTEDELDRVAAAGAFLVHNPESNANNAVGHLDVERAIERGVRVALGTDGMASNMLRAAKSAYLMIRHARRDPTVGFGLPRKLLFENNVALARALFREPKLGVIEPSAPADLCVVDYTPPTPLRDDTFDGHLVFGITEAPVLATVTAGRTRAMRG
jgi:putative selenium metabolism protein SsnA